MKIKTEREEGEKLIKDEFDFALKDNWGKEDVSTFPVKLQFGKEELYSFAIDGLIAETKESHSMGAWWIFRHKFLLKLASERSRDPSLPDIDTMIANINPTDEEQMSFDGLQAIFDELNNQAGGMLKLNYRPKIRKMRIHDPDIKDYRKDEEGDG